MWASSRRYVCDSNEWKAPSRVASAKQALCKLFLMRGKHTVEIPLR